MRFIRRAEVFVAFCVEYIHGFKQKRHQMSLFEAYKLAKSGISLAGLKILYGLRLSPVALI